jgi:hypothetical protein
MQNGSGAGPPQIKAVTAGSPAGQPGWGACRVTALQKTKASPASVYPMPPAVPAAVAVQQARRV